MDQILANIFIYIEIVEVILKKNFFFIFPTLTSPPQQKFFRFAAIFLYNAWNISNLLFLVRPSNLYVSTEDYIF